jgi:AcrR family transcriptional regulator
LNNVQEVFLTEGDKPKMTGPGGRRAELSERLIGAAERLIETQGLASVKARPLAQAAGCALGAIYSVFPDLDTLILAVSARTLARLGAHLEKLGAETQEAAPTGEATSASEAARQGLVALALAYLDFAFAHRGSWRALFEHRLPEGKPVPEWLIADQSRLFGKVEALLDPLVPRLPGSERALLARSLFSAVHGLVLLGLEEKLAPMPLALLREQVVELVTAMAIGLEASHR